MKITFVFVIFFFTLDQSSCIDKHMSDCRVIAILYMYILLYCMLVYCYLYIQSIQTVQWTPMSTRQYSKTSIDHVFFLIKFY